MITNCEIFLFLFTFGNTIGILQPYVYDELWPFIKRNKVVDKNYFLFARYFCKKFIIAL
jgi:hypothetical protein